MFDESLLEDPEGLARADTRGLLRGVAASGARVRTALRLAEEAGVTALQPDGRPRTVLVAGSGPDAAAVADLLTALGSGSCPVEALTPGGPTAQQARWTLPGWAGSLDLLLLISPNGTEQGLTDLVEQAYRRGCTAVAVTPAKAPLAEAVAQVRGLALPFAGPEAGGPVDPTADTAADTGAFWALLTPLLALADRLGLITAPIRELHDLADTLDEVAARCGPAIATYTNPAKTLAAELDDALPLLWSQGRIAAAGARRFAAVLAIRAGRPALSAELPTALALHGPLQAGVHALTADPDDFFRDRVEDSDGLRLRIVLLQEAPDQPGSAAPAAREQAYAHDTPLSEIAAPGGSDLHIAAEILALTDFAAVYLAVASTERP
ncbi:SIS domain-containing protein [Actinacidiphila bryophytorum]|uniref:Phospho-glucose isomerase C-terminal SIS domain-containing protein n=1 Tax=Actinacidiphila bryophytorum TaxID=1436133 RepID=A0A9W4MFW7_9ACTN|nr:SIS domain-containing protein [Actinacidiphila bryophytorum]MBM9440354.1 mannose-6-phosphate isomerase [Actinacidiphila bryophytorum]MBN6544195.1 mannose-6-phosphate isomerase [Actinacidiphila bryophytorum]CAG7636248.1 Phospho-glucose isomerase C-terminal SIS domain-containing protein [Actinacidiphila bryophytorum]